MLLNLGYTPTLVVSSADMVKEITKIHDIVFSDRPKSMAADVLFYGRLDIVFAPYGEHWRQAKKICVHELLSLKRVQSFGFIREEETAGLVRKLRKASSGGFTVNLSQMLIATSNNVISRCILGQKCQEDKTGSAFEELSKRITNQLTSFKFGDYFPYLRWMDVVTGLVSSLEATFKELDLLLEKVIEDHKAALSDKDEQSSDHKDMVDILLQLQKDGVPNMELTNAHIKSILLDMFMAASDALSTMVEWAMVELLNCQTVMKKVKEEVRRVVGNNHNSRIEVNDIDQMDYFKCVIKETLRLHPPAALIPRATSKNSVKLGGYDIPPNTNVHINAWAIQRDPKLWDRPEEFIPERFEGSPVDFRGQEFHFIPFGGGRRVCPGSAFGLFGIEYMLSNLLYWFDWKLPENGANAEDMDMTEASAIAVHKKIPLTVVPIPYIP